MALRYFIDAKPVNLSMDKNYFNPSNLIKFMYEIQNFI